MLAFVIDLLCAQLIFKKLNNTLMILIASMASGITAVIVSMFGALIFNEILTKDQG